MGVPAGEGIEEVPRAKDLQHDGSLAGQIRPEYCKAMRADCA
jgi:hypothetical protein